MKIRKYILPRTVADFGSFIFVMMMLPVTYYFEVFIVLPSSFELWSFWYTVHFLSCSLLLLNIVSSVVVIILCDTSTRSELIPSLMLPNWRFCAVCEAVAPPRSWHCNICNTCILKRDHHCIFTGCCIGHHNQRFFLLFLGYLFVAAAYMTRFNVFFIWRIVEFSHPLHLLKMLFPFAVVIFGIDASEKQCYLLIFLIGVVVTLFSGSLLYHHFICLVRGCVTYEKNRKIDDYNMGLKNNIVCVFGNRWYISWISPLIPSKLPHNGVHWETMSAYQEILKTR